MVYIGLQNFSDGNPYLELKPLDYGPVTGVENEFGLRGRTIYGKKFIIKKENI